MTAASLTPEKLCSELETAALSLQDVHADHAGTVVAHAEAKQALELARAKLLCAGVEGRNAEAREAAIRLELETEHEELHKAEVALTEARCGLDRAKLEWDLARYTVRALEVGHLREAA